MLLTSHYVRAEISLAWWHIECTSKDFGRPCSINPVQDKSAPVVLVAVDGSGDAANAIAVAARMAGRFGSDLHIAHVVERIPRTREALDQPLSREELLSGGEDVLQRATAQARESFRGVIRGHLTEGVPSEEVVALAAQQRADFLLVGTHGRTGLVRTLLGSIAEQVVRHAPCPVVVVPRHVERTHEGSRRAIEISLQAPR